MPVRLLDVTIYESSSGPWRAERTLDPAWGDVESAVRRLDGDRFPSIGLFLDQEATADEVPDFELLGGKVGCVLTARPGHGEFYYRDDSAPRQEVEVWVSDEGFSCPQFMVCPDIEGVLAATRCFFETGQLLQDFPWSPNFG